VVKGFMVQMGDPTGTGQGGESIWGKPFKDEIHGRIKFNHRGQVAMANANKPHSNESQFFITLDSCEWLAGKHTIFGKVTGNTFFNVLRMGDVEVGRDDKPTEDIKIFRIEVLSNPFDDIVPRAIKRDADASLASKKEDDKRKNVKVYFYQSLFLSQHSIYC
jgi:peptidyl-prolyl cis-trans isomerase SDCCAG10